MIPQRRPRLRPRPESLSFRGEARISTESTPLMMTRFLSFRMTRNLASIGLDAESDPSRPRETKRLRGGIPAAPITG